MPNQLRYITNENGEQIGVVLNIEHYQHLRTQIETNVDAELLAEISNAELQALAESMLAPSAQMRLN